MVNAASPGRVIINLFNMTTMSALSSRIVSGKTKSAAMNQMSTKRRTTAWLTMFVIGSDLFAVSPVLPLIALKYGVSPAVAGLSVTVFSVVYIVSAPVFGHISDRIGRRRILAISLGVFAGANVCTAAAGNFMWLLGARLLAGGAAAGVSPSVYALVSGTAPGAERGTHLSIAVSGLLASLIIAAPAAAVAGSAIGWQSVFAVLAIGSVVLVWVNLHVWPDIHAGPISGAAQSPLKIWHLGFRLAPTVFWSTAVYTTYTYLGAGLKLSGYPSDKMAEVILFYGCGSIVGILAGGRMADRFGDRATTTLGLGGLCICFLLLRLALGAGVLVGLAFAVVSAVAQIFFPAQQARLAKDFPDRRATVLAWNNSALFLGISIGSVVGGQAISFGGLNGDVAIAAAIAVIGCAINGLSARRFRAGEG